MNSYDETTRLYDDTPYDTEFDARVLNVRPGMSPRTVDVVLDETLFFPEEGGQTPDRGTLAGFPVMDVQISGDHVITHTLDISCSGASSSGAAPGDFPEENNDSPPSVSCAGPDVCRETELPLPETLLPGQLVHGVLDWAHRFSNMQNHSGEHILSGLLHSIYGYENVGFRLSDHTVTLDTGGRLTAGQLLDLERRANEVVWRNVPITCEYPDLERLAAMEYRSKKEIDGAVRIVTIEGVDVCACCAPHVRRTGEIGLIRILSAVNSRGGSTRITLVCGSRALELVQLQQRQAEECSRLMNEPQESISGGVRRLQEEIAGLKEEVHAKEQRIADLRLQEAADGMPSGDIWVFEPALSPLSQRGLMNRLCDAGWRYAGVFTGCDEEGYQYLIGSRSDDARIPNQLLRTHLPARGGGKPAMVQGTVRAAERAIREVLAGL